MNNNRPARERNSRCVAYIRISTEDSHNGPEAQRSAIEAWAAREGLTLVSWHTDQGVSGASPIEAREGLLGALASLREHGASTLVAAKRDRLGRDAMIVAMLEREAEKAGACVRTADGSSDGAGPEGALMRGILDHFAAYERGVIRARTCAALAAKKARGERTGGIPYGFRVGSDGKTLEPEAKEAAIVALARELAANGVSQRRIAEALGLNPRNGRRFMQKQVVNMLQARTYLSES